LPELLGIVDRPDIFSYGELRNATEAFNNSNILGEGGYGPVYKVFILCLIKFCFAFMRKMKMFCCNNSIPPLPIRILPVSSLFNLINKIS
jgi:hypothetical protein